MISSTSIFLIFSFMNNNGVIADNRILTFDSVEECVLVNNQNATMFHKQYPNGAYEGQCISNGQIVHINQQYAGKLISKQFRNCND